MPSKADPKRDDSDSALWRRAMRDVKPVAPRAAAPRAIFRPEPSPPEVPLPPLTIDRFAGIDRANAERLKRGKRKIEARLDLHGMTQDEAHRTLLEFVRAARAAGKRCVLVITGRGNFGGGVLKAAVPRWLAETEFRPHILAIATAQPRDGGAGALYVMLRRNATDSER
jgi:DNA-nicking Smr family endonuclease